MPLAGDSKSTIELPTSLAETRELPPRPPGAEPLPRVVEPGRSPLVIDRFVAQRELGRGGMGIVYLAEDPRLGRPVALKLLDRPRGDPGAQQRMRREAQALAKLSHPNVVQIYGTGSFEGRTYIAMELVEGPTLRDWQREATRTRDELLDAYAQAGAGLAAAHAKGLVHRDFKPSNVVVGTDGRVRVLDFGLVRTGNTGAFEAIDERSTRPLERALPPEGAGDPFQSTLTATNVVMGTPFYMAPELHQGATATAKSDQFAFCVSLYEALYGERPFEAKEFRELVAVVLQGKVPPPPPGSSVPRRLRRLVLRGLRVDPERRWPSMEALLAALAAIRRPPARRRRLIGAAVVGAAVIAAVGLIMQPRAPPCATAEQELAGVWDAARKDAIGQRMHHEPEPWMPLEWERTAAALDDYTARWSEIHEQACAADHGPESLARRAACLDQQRHALGAALDALATGDPQAALAKARQSIRAVGDPADCLSAAGDQPATVPPLDEEEARERERIEQQLAQVRDGFRQGRYRETEAQAQAALEDARRLGHPALVARATMLAGAIHFNTGNTAEGIAMLEQAYFDARALGETGTMDYAAGLLVGIHGSVTGDVRVVRRWAEHAWAATEGDDDPGDVMATMGLATMLFDLAELEQAQALLEPLLARLEQRVPRDEVMIASVQAKLGEVLRDLERPTEALPLLERARATLEAELGRTHPLVTGTVGAIASTLVDMGEYDRATRLFHELLELHEQTRGPDHPHVGVMLANLGVVHSQAGRYDEALRYYLLALERFERHFGPESLKTAELRGNISSALGKLGRYEEAIAERRESMRIHEQLQGKLYPAFADQLEYIADLQERAGDLEGARESRERWRALQEASPSSDAPAGSDGSGSTGTP